MHRAWFAGGAVGPVAFVAAWAWGSATTDRYSPVSDPISRLAAVGASSRPVMTAGLLAFAAGVGAYAVALRAEVPGRAWVPAAVTAASSVAIAATPLEGPWGGAPHGVAAGTAYASLAALVAVGARPVVALASGAGPRRVDGSPVDAASGAGGRRVGGCPAAVAASWAAAATCGACLLASVAGPESATGLLQRAGLGVGHAWIAATALALLRRS